MRAPAATSVEPTKASQSTGAILDLPLKVGDLQSQRLEDKLSEPMADVLALCRERWQQHKRTTRKDVVRECSTYKDNDRKALRHLRSLEGMGLLESKANTTEIGFKPTE